MSGFRPPPPGAMPSGMGSPDISSLMEDATNGAQQTTSQSAASASSSVVSPPGHGASQKTARPIGSPTQEAKYLANDVAGGLFDLLPPVIKNLVSPNPTDSPEESMKKKQMFQRYTQLNSEQQAYVSKKLQAEQVEKQKQHEEEMRQKQLAAQQSSELPVPEGKKTGEAAMGGGKSNKSQTISKLQNDRKKLSSSG